MAIYLLTGLLKTIKVAVREKCFLIESHFIVPTGLIGCVAAKILRKPFTVSAHGADITTTDTGLSIAAHPLLKKLIKIVLRRADYVIANSEFSKKILESLGADPSKIQITWAGGIDESMFYPVKDKALLRDKFRLSHDEVIILFVGNLTRKKGVNFLVESFRQMKAKKLSLRLLLVGDGEVRKELETEIIRTGMENDILLMGALPYAQVSEIYALSDIFVLPSLMEGMGRVIIEAMSSGLAVIGSRVGGINDLIQDGKDGILFQPGSVDDLTRCLNLLIGDEELRLKLGAEARLKVKNKFSRKIQKQKMNEIYTRFSATGARK
jgi:glycosyltransferase involved in cell wall biosynthesis